MPEGEPEPGAASERGQHGLVAAVAIGLIVIYVGMLVVLVLMRGDQNWDRLVFLLSGFEALVFTGAGALFGTTVQRATVNAARQDAADAKREVASERTRANAATEQATAGRLLSRAISAKAQARAGLLPEPGLTARGARPDEHAAGGYSDRDLAELAEMARQLFPTDDTHE